MNAKIIHNFANFDQCCQILSETFIEMFTDPVHKEEEAEVMKKIYSWSLEEHDNEESLFEGMNDCPDFTEEARKLGYGLFSYRQVPDNLQSLLKKTKLWFEL